MANLWHNSSRDVWIPTELRTTALLGGDPIEFVEQTSTDLPRGEVLLFQSCGKDEISRWLLLAPRNIPVRINNTSLECGIRVLADRDAIRISDRPTVYFSIEQLARIVAFPDVEQTCARCKLPISKGDDALCCPQCGVWHHEHQGEGRKCWSYGDRCTVCNQVTDLDLADFRWTPGGL